MHAAKRTVEELTRLDGKPDFGAHHRTGEGVLRLRTTYIEGPPALHGKAQAAVQGTIGSMGGRDLAVLSREAGRRPRRDGYLWSEIRDSPASSRRSTRDRVVVEQAVRMQRPSGRRRYAWRAAGRASTCGARTQCGKAGACGRITIPRTISKAYREGTCCDRAHGRHGSRP